MKLVTNWRNGTYFDLESDGLLREATKIHVLSYHMANGKKGSIRGDDYKKLKAFFQYHLDNHIPVVGHNIISFDVPLAEKLLNIDLSDIVAVDTLALSWYLNIDRKQHGLDSFLSDYGIAKPKIDDWNNLSYEEYEFRCSEDVRLTKTLWEDFQERLVEMYTLSKEAVDNGSVGGKRVSPDEVLHIDSKVGLSVDEWIDEILTFLMFKMDCARIQERTGFKLDEELVKDSIEELEAKFNEAKDALESVMPKIVKYKDKKKPAKMFKKNGEKTKGGEEWDAVVKYYNNKAVDENGSLLVIQSNKEGHLKVLSHYEPPNANSYPQLKSFLFDRGWVPQSYEYKRDDKAFDLWIKSKPKKGSSQADWQMWKESRPEDRAIPQITIKGDSGKELCPSVAELAEEVEEVAYLNDYGVVSHRLGILKGFINNVEGGRLQARIAGFTNTLRVKHVGLTNLPKADSKFGEAVRGGLVADEGQLLCGSDLSSLEDRVKLSLMLPYDPDYVKEMSVEGYDPHLSLAVLAKAITLQDMEEYKSGNKLPHVKVARPIFKAGNYLCQYGGQPLKLSLTAKIDLEMSKTVVDAYAKKNWAIQAIADDQVVIKTSRGETWLVNPYNGFCYSLRSDKDRFSTLCQGTGSFFFDMWVDGVLTRMVKVAGYAKQSAAFHDEGVWPVKDNPAAINWITQTVENSLADVNNKYMPRRLLECDIQFGKAYSLIH